MTSRLLLARDSIRIPDLRHSRSGTRSRLIFVAQILLLEEYRSSSMISEAALRQIAATCRVPIAPMLTLRRNSRSLLNPTAYLGMAASARASSQTSKLQSALASRSIFTSEILRSPRSTPLMYVRCRSARSASFSCEMPIVGGFLGVVCQIEQARRPKMIPFHCVNGLCLYPLTALWHRCILSVYSLYVTVTYRLQYWESLTWVLLIG